MKRAMIILLCLLISGCSSQKKAEYRQITQQQAMEIMESESGYIILDVRRPDEFAEGHIPGAICLPNEQIGTSEPDILPDKKQLILVYCRSGNRSKQASEKLAAMGYENVMEFGGIITWPGEITRD
ncbi:MAG: rhodanese-like domain-containing protein [Erysipelotrichaceae bacterium]|nr:rhodanese-like domain-containing protein [Erysipelotrichaceae bacterium]